MYFQYYFANRCIKREFHKPFTTFASVYADTINTATHVVNSAYYRIITQLYLMCLYYSCHFLILKQF